MKKIPELRFPGFEGDFDANTLGSLSTNISYGMNVAATDYDGENKYLRITDIDENNNNYIKSGVMSPDGDMENKFLLEEGDILFARTGASTGKTYFYKPTDGKVYYAGFLIRAKIKKDYNHRLVFYNTLTHRYKSWVNSMSARSGQPGINASEYSSFIVRVPKSKEEQQKIADFFSTLDSRIENQGEKIKNLEEQKKGYMQRIFSQEIRFKDENGEDYPEWKEKRVKDLGRIVTGTTPSTKDSSYYEGGSYLWVTPTDINQKYSYTTERKLTLEGLNKSRFLPKGSVLVTCIASIGKNSIIPEDGSCNQQINAIITNKQNYNEFVYYLIEIGANKLRRYAGAGGMQILNKSDFEKIKFEVPSLPEQQKIANFLSLFDEKIEIEKKILETLQEMKKGFLQKMFV